MKNLTATSRQGSDWVKTFALFIFYGAAGFLGNWFKLQLFFNVDFLFGSFFVMLAVARLTAPAACCIALIAGSCTWLLWNHPWAMVTFVMEAAFVAMVNRRKPGIILLADTFFWLFLGMPLVWLFYHVFMHIPNQATQLIALKQSINGIFNALLATMLIYWVPLLRRTVPERVRPVPLRELIVTTLVAAVMMPTFVDMVLDIRKNMADNNAAMVRHTRQVSESVRNLVSSWITENHESVIALASQVGDPASTPFREMQKLTTTVHLANRNLLRVGVLDNKAVTVSFSPLIDSVGKSTLGRDFSDRPFIPPMRQTLRPLVPDVVPGRIGPRTPILPLVAPIVVNGAYRGYCTGILDLGKLGKQIGAFKEKAGYDLTILDREGRFIASTREKWEPMGKFSRPADGRLQAVTADVTHWIPAAVKGTSIMQRWKSSYYFKEEKISSEIPWTVVVETSLTGYLNDLTQMTIDTFQMLWMVLLLMLAISYLISRSIVVPLNRLEHATSELSDKLTGVTDINWPASGIKEIRSLTGNFRDMSLALIRSFGDLVKLNHELEKRVDERTRELKEREESLEALNRSLEGRVRSAVDEIRVKDALMLQQSRLAAMGEMINNIAHQWRQPLNNLGLIIQNNCFEYEAGVMTREQMAIDTKKSMELIQFMSQTINDFSRFFRKDKEKTTFRVREILDKALGLIEANLRSHAIRVSIESADETIEVEGYQNEYSQALLNLLCNARDVLLEREVKQPEIFIAFFREAGRVVVTVRDNAGGIDDHLIDRVFDPYFTTKEQGKGTGIGLYMSKVIIEQHMSGSLTVKNTDVGAEFRVVL